MHRERTAKVALLAREHSPGSNSAQASFPDYEEIKYSSIYRNNTISFPLPSTRWQHTYHKGVTTLPHYYHAGRLSHNATNLGLQYRHSPKYSQGQQPRAQGSCPTNSGSVKLNHTATTLHLNFSTPCI